VKITWLGHSTVLLEAGAARLLTDPVLRRRVAHLRRHGGAALDPQPLDGVLVSHVHRDHLDRPTLRALAGSGTAVVVPRGAARFVASMPFGAVREVTAGDAVRVAGVAVHAVPAWHEARRHPASKPVESLGFLVERVWFAGDTDLHRDMAALRGKVDVALLPVWGWRPTLGPGHLDPAGAAQVVALVEPAVAVPIHWGTFLPIGLGRRHGRLLTDPPAEFEAQVASTAPETRVVVLSPGETFEVQQPSSQA
jgi:L-ascorbate metabolism protein UlaG (beta-lactamase superfamily)